MSDTEKVAGLPNRPGGHDRLGRLMGAVPETAIFRRFGALSAEDLLYRQAELADLEACLRKSQQEDEASGHPDRERYSVNWGKLSRSAEEDAPEGNDSTQMETILEIRKKLEEYQEALIRHRKILEFGQPIPHQVQALKEWMTWPSMGNVYLDGSDRNIWAEPDLDDLVALAPPTTDRALTNAFTIKMIRLYNRVLGRYIHKAGDQDFMRNTIRYTELGTFRVLKAVVTILACLLPIGGIGVLYVIHTMPGRLGAIAGFTALFSFCLSIVTSASIQQVFSATAAFAAVLVVFVGTSDLGNGSGSSSQS